MVLALIGLQGCNEGTPGGPGVTTGPGKESITEKPVFGPADDTFNLTVPTMSTKLVQGGTTDATVGISRGTNFDGDVTLEITTLPEGVTVESSSPLIKHGDTDVKLSFKAVDTAALGDFTIKITGHPGKGADATTELKLNVAKE